MYKKSHKDKAIIEKKEIITVNTKIALFKYFLLIIDTLSSKIVSTYGPYDTPEQAAEVAKWTGVELG